MLIGLTGRPGVGKDTVAAVLATAGWRATAFANALRTEVAAAWMVDPRLFTDRASKEAVHPALLPAHVYDRSWLEWCAVQGANLMHPRSPRWLLQQWGQWRRSQDAQHWTRHVAVWVDTQRREGWQHLVVTDVRHANEAAALLALGGHLVRVHRPGLPPLPADTASHASELQAAQLQATAEIHNDGPVTALPAEVWRVVQELPTFPA